MEFDANDFQQDVIVDDISVSEVAPEFGTLALFDSALIGLVVLQRRRSLRAI